MRTAAVERGDGAPALAYSARDGRSPTLVLVHGNSCERSIWEPLLAELPEQAAIALDLRGHGHSAWARPPAYGTEDYAGDIASLVRHLRLEDFVLVGHSNGAVASLAYSIFHEPRPRALLFLDIAPKVPEYQVEYFRQRAGTVGRPLSSVARLAAGMKSVDETVPDAVLDAYARRLVRETPEGLRLRLDPETYGSWRPADLRPVLGRLAAPLTIVRAGASSVMSPDAAEAMRDAVPGSRLVVIDGAGHLLMLSKAAALAAVILETIEALSEG